MGLAALRASAGSSAEVAAGVCACLADWTGGAPVHDDRTVLVIRRGQRRR